MSKIICNVCHQDPGCYTCSDGICKICGNDIFQQIRLGNIKVEPDPNRVVWRRPKKRDVGKLD